MLSKIVTLSPDAHQMSHFKAKNSPNSI